MYTSLAVITFVGGCVFYACFRNSLGRIPVLDSLENREELESRSKEMEMGKADV